MSCREVIRLVFQAALGLVAITLSGCGSSSPSGSATTTTTTTTPFETTIKLQVNKEAQVPQDGAMYAHIGASTAVFPSNATCQFTGAQAFVSASPLECKASWNLAVNCAPSESDVDIDGLVGFHTIENRTTSLKEQNVTWKCNSFGVHVYFMAGKSTEQCNITFKANITGHCTLALGDSLIV